MFDFDWSLLNSTQIKTVFEKSNERRVSANIFPPKEKVFKAFRLCPFEKVKVVILGQDPYFRTGQATGLAFACKLGTKIPPSLKNILKEVEMEYGDKPLPTLSSWARQGVLLLNTALTVEEGKPNSHQNLGWNILVEKVIHRVSLKRKHVVFMLWGRKAQEYEKFIERIEDHCVLKCAHPSPFSCKGFFGCNHFIKANHFFESHSLKSIDWTR